MNTVKAFCKVIPARKPAFKGQFFAGITCDTTGPKTFYGTESECWEVINNWRTTFHALGIETVQQCAPL